MNKYRSWDEVPEYVCEKCDHEWQEIPERSYEGADADGNRGVWVNWVTCPNCNEEYGYY